MTIEQISKYHISIKVDTEEVIDTEMYAPELGQVKLYPCYFEGSGNLEVSADKEEWITLTDNEKELMPNTSNYPQFIRSTAEATIHFNANK